MYDSSRACMYGMSLDGGGVEQTKAMTTALSLEKNKVGRRQPR